MEKHIKLYWASSNSAKTVQLIKSMEPYSQFIKIIPVHIEIDEIQSLDNRVVAQDKITKLYKYVSTKYSQTNFHLVCEDTGYSYANANGFPGALIRFYHDAIGNSGICKAHGGSRATNTSCVAYTDGTEIMLFTNHVTGEVPHSPRPCVLGKYIGTVTGLDRIFIPDYPDKLTQFKNSAYSEIPWDVHLQVSARAQSFSDLANYLMEKLNNNQVSSLTNYSTQADLMAGLDGNSDSDFDSDSDSEPDEFDEALCDALSLQVLTGHAYESYNEFDIN